MPATTIGTTGAIFGLTAESNLLVQSYSQTAESDKAEVRNEVGDIKAVGTFNRRGTFSMEAYTAGAFPVTAGATLSTLANLVTGYGGVTTGTILVDNVAANKTNQDFQKITVAGTIYPFV